MAAADSTRLTTPRKLGYGFGNIGASLSYSAVSFFFLFYLVEIAGLRPALAGIVLLCGRIFDAITDPLMGLLSDRTKSRWGRRRPYLLFGAVPFGLSFALMWMIPEGPQTTIFVLALLVAFLHMLFFAMVTIPYSALTPELAPNYDERTSLTGYSTAFAVVAALIASAVPPAFAASLNAGQGLAEDARYGWAVVGSVFGVVMVVGWFTVVASVRESPQLDAHPVKLEILEEYRSALKTFGYRSMLLMFFLVTMAMGIASALLPFYLKSGVGLPPDQQSSMLGLAFGVAVLALPVWTRLGARFGKKLCLAVGVAMYAAGLFLQVTLAPRGHVSPILVVTAVVIGLGMAAALLFPWAMLPDVLEFDELETGKRREGLFYSVFAIAQKAAYAVGALVSAQALDYFGYDRNAAQQPESALFGITLLIGPVLTVLCCGAIVVVWRYPITRENHDQARAKLAARAGTALATG